MHIEGQARLLGNALTGWARAKDNPSPLWIELVADGEAMDIAIANLPQNGGCGFWMNIPPVLLEEGADIQARVANTAILLEKAEDGDAEPETAGILGEVFVDRGLTVSGWARDPFSPDNRLTIRAVVDGKTLAQTVACGKYWRAGEGNGYGYKLNLPLALADGEERLVEISDELNRPVPGSPVLVRIAEKSMVEWIKNNIKTDPDRRDMLTGMFQYMERRLPAAAASADLQTWKKVFQPPKIRETRKTRIKILGIEKEAKKLLSGQQGIDLAFGNAPWDCMLVMRPEDNLAANALGCLIRSLDAPDAMLAYGDGENGASAIFKPDWDKIAFLGRDYLGPFLVRREAVAAATLDGNEEYFAARFKLVMAAQKMGKIVHLPHILSQEAELPANHRLEEGISRLLEKELPGAVAVEGNTPGFARIRFTPVERPGVSILIATKDRADLLEKCLASLANTDWPDYEIVIIDNGSSEADALALLETCESRDNFKILRLPGVFNYSFLNNSAARAASGNLLCFLNNDTEALAADWLAELVSALLLLGPEAGCAGAKLLWPNGLVQHGGVVVGLHGLAAHAGNGWLDEEPGYMGRNQIMQQYSAVTAACMLTPRKLFLDSGGFDEKNFPVAFNDVDYCLRLGSMGKKTVWTPWARLLHHESASRGKDRMGADRARSSREIKYFRTKWGWYEDPFYNPNLPLSTVSDLFDGLAWPPRSRISRQQKP